MREECEEKRALERFHAVKHTSAMIYLTNWLSIRRRMMAKTIAGFLMFALIAVYSFGGTATASFDAMKALEGKWTGKNSKGEAVSVSYELVANGTALVETLHGMNEIMTTVYHTDGSNLMMTHYCGAGNQPRMRADLSGGNAKVIP